MLNTMVVLSVQGSGGHKCPRPWWYNTTKKTVVILRMSTGPPLKAILMPCIPPPNKVEHMNPTINQRRTNQQYQYDIDCVERKYRPFHFETRHELYEYVKWTHENKIHRHDVVSQDGWVITTTGNTIPYEQWTHRPPEEWINDDSGAIRYLGFNPQSWKSYKMNIQLDTDDQPTSTAVKTGPNYNHTKRRGQ